MVEVIAFANARSRREGLQECVVLDNCSGVIGETFRCSGIRQTTTSVYDCMGYRLPTDVEVEYATRAGTTTAFFSGPFEPASTECIEIPHLSEVAWYCANSENHTHPVCTRKPNPFGLCDMTGNACEFASTHNQPPGVPGEPSVDPNATLHPDGRFGQTLSIYFGWPSILRSATPVTATATAQDVRRNLAGPGLGFRLVRSITPEEATKWSGP